MDVDTDSYCDVKDIIFLNKSKTAWITINYLPQEIIKYASKNYSKLFDLHPIHRHRVAHRKYLDENNDTYIDTDSICSRYQSSYGKTPKQNLKLSLSYMYSGVDDSLINDDIPIDFKPFYDYIYSIDSQYNQCIVNWYNDGKDFIPHHSDCTIGMIPDPKVSIISLYPNDDTYRTLSIKPKKRYGEYLDKDYNYDKININMKQGSIITMGGSSMHHAFTHGINKDTNEYSRISVSFRQML